MGIASGSGISSSRNYHNNPQPNEPLHHAEGEPNGQVVSELRFIDCVPGLWLLIAQSDHINSSDVRSRFFNLERYRIAAMLSVLIDLSTKRVGGSGRPDFGSMKVLHTADWHLGDCLGRIDRTDDLRQAVERIAEYCRTEHADLLLVAGDIFSELARPDSLRQAVEHLQDVFREFLQTGGTILAVTGNHDNENFCLSLSHAMNLAAPTVGEIGDVISPGRLYLAARPTFLRLPDPESGSFLQFVLMPYPTPSRLFLNSRDRAFSSPKEKNRLLAELWTRILEEFRTHPRFDPCLTTVLVTHIHVRDAIVGKNLFRMTHDEDVLVDRLNWSEQFAYVALGHIHKPQILGGSPNVRYSGSIERLDLDERADEKGVVFLEIGPKGLRGEPTVLPLPATAIYEVLIREPSVDLPRLRADYPNAKNDLVQLKITYTAGKDNLDDVLGELNEIFPRWYLREWRESGSLEPTFFNRENLPSQGFAETVRTYLTQELLQHPQYQRDAILTLVEEILAELQYD